MVNYLVVTPNKLIGFETHKEAHSHYMTQSKPCGVYEVSEVDENLH